MVCQITPSGHAEVLELRDSILRDARLKPGPVDLVIQFLHDDLTSEEACMELVLRAGMS